VTCPICKQPCEQDTVDNGVGDQAIGDPYCPDCQWSLGYCVPGVDCQEHQWPMPHGEAAR